MQNSQHLVQMSQAEPGVSVKHIEDGDGLPRYKRLRVFVLDEGLPYPLDSGKRIRTWHLLSRLAVRHDLTFFCFDEGDPAAQRFVENQGIRVILGPALGKPTKISLYSKLFANLFSPYPFSVSKHYSRQFHKEILARINSESPDLIHVEWTPYARYLSGISTPKTVIATHNIEAQIWLRRARHSGTPLEKAFFAIQAIKMRAFERRCLSRAHEVTAVSAEDLEWLEKEGITQSGLVENGVDTEYFQPTMGCEVKQEILLLASLDWYPNQDAVRYFVSEIMPRVRAKLPDAKVKIVGRRPPNDLVSQIRSVPGATLFSDVPDVRPFLAQSSAFVVPLRIGGGSRIKILEALAAGKAIVSTPIGAEGLELRSGEHLLVAERPDDFADRVIDVLTQPELRQKLGREGRGLVADRYTWNQMADRLELAWLRADSARPPGQAPRPCGEAAP
jgi:glycosyltransferase involved in cell wall biosynthesis